MKVNSGTIIGILGVLTALIVFLAQYCNPKPNPSLYPKDTIYLDRVIIHRDTIKLQGEAQKPIYVERPLKDTIYLVNNLHDTIKIANVEIPNRFPVVIAGEFWDDHLKLITRDTTGQILTNTWLYDWVKNTRYLYDGYSGKLLPVPKGTGDLSDDFGNGTLKVPKLPGFHSNAYLLYGTRKNFMIRGDASLEYKKFGLYLYGQLNTALPNAEAGVGLKYNLK